MLTRNYNSRLIKLSESKLFRGATQAFPLELRRADMIKIGEEGALIHAGCLETGSASGLMNLAGYGSWRS